MFILYKEQKHTKGCFSRYPTYIHSTMCGIIIFFFAYMFNTNNNVNTTVSFIHSPRIGNIYNMQRFYSRISCDPIYWIYFEEFVPRAILLWLGFLHAAWDMLWKIFQYVWLMAFRAFYAACCLFLAFICTFFTLAVVLYSHTFFGEWKQGHTNTPQERAKIVLWKKCKGIPFW